jgi:hypothetical protein
MSATNAVEDALLSLIFTATTWDGFAENDTSSPKTAYYISLHTSDPGEAGSQTAGETAYTGYARVSVDRDTDAWTVSSGSCTNDAEIAFPICTASPGSAITHVGIGTDSSGAGTLLFSFALDSSVTMQVGTTPLFSAGELEIQCS